MSSMRHLVIAVHPQVRRIGFIVVCHRLCWLITGCSRLAGVLRGQAAWCRVAGLQLSLVHRLLLFAGLHIARGRLLIEVDHGVGPTVC